MLIFVQQTTILLNIIPTLKRHKTQTTSNINRFKHMNRKYKND